MFVFRPTEINFFVFFLGYLEDINENGSIFHPCFPQEKGKNVCSMDDYNCAELYEGFLTINCRGVSDDVSFEMKMKERELLFFRSNTST